MRLISIVVVIVAVVVGAGVASRRVEAQVSGPVAVDPSSLRPEHLRFRVIANEPLSGGTTIVPNTQVWVVKDMKRMHCFTLFFVGTSQSLTGPAPCPE